MNTAEATDLVTEVASAHGAATLQAAERIDVRFSSGGLAFAAKRQPHALRDATASIHPTRQEVALGGRQPRPWAISIRGSSDLRARLEALRRGRRRIHWEPEGLGAFAAGALWTYLTMPLLLADAEDLVRLPDAAGRRRLRVTLPSWIAGHGPVQVLHIGPTGLVERHDYTATAFGGWARAAQTITAYTTFDGVPVGTRRCVTPRLAARGLPAPNLVWIDLHDLRIT